ncbi:MAG: hypothetical protein R8K46_00915 [Mariprofundaceae bacterium]
MITWAKYVPALFFFILWGQFINDQLAVERTVFTSTLESLAMDHGLDGPMDNPWQRKGAGMLYFRRLAREGAPDEVWLNSDVYAQAVWEQGQFPGSLETLVKIAVLKNNQTEINRLSRLYLSAYPHLPFATTIKGYFRSRQAGHSG